MHGLCYSAGLYSHTDFRRIYVRSDVILLYNNVYVYEYHRKTRGNPEVIFSNKRKKKKELVDSNIFLADSSTGFVVVS